MHPIVRTLAFSVLLVLSETPPAAADPVLEWNTAALHAAGSASFNPPLEARNLAIVHAAIFDAANAFRGEFRPYAVRLQPPAGASQDAAVIAAAHRTLVRLYPEQTPALDALASESLGQLPSGPSREAGVAFGREVADQLLSLRASDGAAEAIAASYCPGSGPGAWVPTPSAFRPALDPGWGTVAPFLLRIPSQFRPHPPPALPSRQYTTDFLEIRDVGSLGSTTRTAEQTALARLWISTAPQVWNPVARQLLQASGLGGARAARVLALLHLATADAFIAAWDAKFFFSQWRPVTAIRAAESDGNPATKPDPRWEPLIATPPFPDYPAGHTACAGAAEVVLEHLFGRHPGRPLELTSATAPGVVVRAATVGEIAQGVVNARVWGGVHWRTSSEEGRRIGRHIGHLGVRHFLRPVASKEPAGDDEDD
jgi:hypothetical protein